MLKSFLAYLKDARDKQPATLLQIIVALITAVLSGIAWLSGYWTLAVAFVSATAMLIVLLVVAFPGLFEWRWLDRLRFGIVLLTSPKDGEGIPVGPSELKGSHWGASGAYWVLAVDGPDYWLHNPISLKPNGTWILPINVGYDPTPRPTSIIIVWVSNSVDSLLAAIKERNNQFDCHGIPLKMIRDKRNLVVLDSAVLKIEPRGE